MTNQLLIIKDGLWLEKNRNLNKAEPSIPELKKELTSEEVVEIAKKYDFDCQDMIIKLQALIFVMRIILLTKK